MSDQGPPDGLSHIETELVNGIVMPADHSTPPPGECFKAKVLRAVFDIPSTAIPEDLEALNFDGYTCPFVSNDGKECMFTDPMIFLKYKVGFIAMGSRNFCELELSSPKDFKKASIGNVAVRTVRLGKELNARLRNKFTK